MPKAFLVDTTRCTACRGCQVACKEWARSAGQCHKTARHASESPGSQSLQLQNRAFSRASERGGRRGLEFLSRSVPSLLDARVRGRGGYGRAGAMVKDAKTGAVLAQTNPPGLNAEDARAITEACPYNIPRYDAAAKRITKCDMCIDRVEAGCRPCASKPVPPGPWSLTSATPC